MANRIRDPGREAFWRRIVTMREKSGLSVREFCRREKLRESAFYFWRRTIRQRRGTRRGPKPRTSKPPAFVPLVLSDVGTTGGIALEVRGGRTLRFNESFPVELLAGLVIALEAAEGRP
jgi:transposase-like protein